MENTIEFWKDVDGYEGHYQVSNLGRVKSIKFGKEIILKEGVDSSGYPLISVYKDGTKKTRTIHQIVAIAFLGHKPNGYSVVVDHVDCNKMNNRLYNLQIISQRDNVTKDLRRGVSKYVGVSWKKQSKKWVASIWINGTKKHIGYFINEIEASNAYQKAKNNLNE